MDKITINKLLNVFPNNKQKPWITSKNISKRLNRQEIGNFSQKEIEELLIRHTKTKDRKIRYSHYPSRKSLDLLWGKINLVGEKYYLPALDNISEPLKLDNTKEKYEKSIFLSHNHRDLENILQIRKLFINNGYGIWIHETEIPIGGQIISTVLKAANDCDYFVSYLTLNSIGSLWTNKELDYFTRSNSGKIIILFDGTESSILNYFKSWGRREHNEYKKNLINNSFELNGSKEIWRKRSKEFLHTADNILKDNKLAVSFPRIGVDHLERSTELNIIGLEDIFNKKSNLLLI